jgi:hypothetical protein
MPNAGLMPDLLALRDSNNLYVYALNNPLKYTDSTGNFPNVLDLTGALLPKTSILKHIISALPTAGMPAYEFTEAIIENASPDNTKLATSIQIGLVIMNTPYKMVDAVEKSITGTAIKTLGEVNEDGTISISEFDLKMAQVTGQGLTAYLLGIAMPGYSSKFACPQAKPLSAPNIANAPIRQPVVAANPPLKPVGAAFNPQGRNVQIGVNPNTLTPAKNLNSLDSFRQRAAVTHAGDRPIIVDKTGRVLDGHHRLNDAIQNNRLVDIQIGY